MTSAVSPVFFTVSHIYVCKTNVEKATTVSEAIPANAELADLDALCSAHCCTAARHCFRRYRTAGRP